MTRGPWSVFAGGGTGGHLFPALAVVEALRSRGGTIDVTFFCSERAIDGEILGRAGVEAVAQRVQPFSGRPWRWPAFLKRWRQSVLACRRAFGRRRPALVVGAGGYASAPPVAAALRLGVPTFLLNPDALPGRANRHLAARGKLAGIFVQWPVTRDYLPPAVPVHVTGCPVRRAFLSLTGRLAGLDSADPQAVEAVSEIRRSFGLEPRRRTLLVTGASQGARTVNEAMIQLAGAVAAAQWQVLHLSGPADRERVTQGYARARTAAVVLPFTERIEEAMAACDLIVSRAGASTLAEILAAGKPALLLPYPFHRDRHQRHNAAVLVEAGAAVMLDDLKDPDANAGRMGPVLTGLMTADGQRAIMARAARGLARPQAADQIADRLCQVARNGCASACEIPQDEGVKFCRAQGRETVNRPKGI